MMSSKVLDELMRKSNSALHDDTIDQWNSCIAISTLYVVKIVRSTLHRNKRPNITLQQYHPIKFLHHHSSVV